MTRQQALGLVALLKAAYPRQDVTPETAEAYALLLADLDADEAAQAVVTTTQTNRWWPTISELRETVARHKLTQTGERLYESGTEAWHRVVTAGAPQDSITKTLRQPDAWDRKNWTPDELAWCRKAFIDTYDAIADQRLASTIAAPQCTPGPIDENGQKMVNTAVKKLAASLARP